MGYVGVHVRCGQSRGELPTDLLELVLDNRLCRTKERQEMFEAVPQTVQRGGRASTGRCRGPHFGSAIEQPPV